MHNGTERWIRVLEGSAKQIIRNDDMQIMVVDIDYDLASLLLERIPKEQRGISQVWVRRYAREMRDGRWRQTGDPIQVDTEMNLLNGQHRLSAVLECAGEFVLKNAVVNILMDPAAFFGMDTGRIRTSGDLMRLAEPDKTNRARSSELRAIVLEHVDFDATKYAALSKQERVQIARDSGWVPFLREVAGQKRVHGAILAAAIRCAKQNRAEALKFFRAVIENRHVIDGRESAPARLLATHVLDTKRDGQRTAGEGVTRDFIIRCFKAWNAYRADKPLKILRVRSHESIPQAL